MEIFHELYGRYYQNVARILVETPCTRAVIQETIKRQGFEESLLFLMPKITDQAEWGFLQQEEQIWYSKLRYEPYIPTTTLERRWMKAQLNDRRISFFLSDSLRKKLLESLEEEALYVQEDFDYFDRSQKGDPYEKELYQKVMRAVLNGLYRRAELEITYQKEEKGQMWEERKKYLPLRLMYLIKDDRFVLYAASQDRDQVMVLNVKDIVDVSILKECQSTDRLVQQLLKRGTEKTVAVVRIRDERGALERFMIQMTDFQKETKEEENQCVTVKIFYRQEQRQKLTKRFLSMGPMLQVLEPEEIRREIKKKIQDQVRRFF